jgi:hypothetical protein
MTDNGDQHLRDAGITLPCAKEFGFVIGVVMLRHCDRPYGHTGEHTAAGDLNMRGGRDAEDEARTMWALTQILKKESA